VASELRASGVVSVSLGGGEPFIRADIADVVGAFTSRGMFVRALSNGVAPTDQAIAACVEAGLTEVSISLDTLDPAKQSHVYGIPDALEKIQHSVRRFAAVLPRGKGVSILNVVVSRLNLDELPALADYAAQNGFMCSFVPIVLLSEGDKSDPWAAHAPEMAIEPSDHGRLDAAYDRLLALRDQGGVLNTRRFLEDSREYLKTGRTGWKCHAGDLYFSVSPSGDLSYCHLAQPIGSLLRDDMRALLAADGYERRRRAFVSACAGCMRPCWAEVTHMMSDPLALARLGLARLRR
jgi:MoaA/NifB/PqqE/SkfB family radical SAM enzyme